jgi:outer membrane protein assembly factor BamE (lipoprotein component of BamABCDE complex)
MQDASPQKKPALGAKGRFATLRLWLVLAAVVAVAIFFCAGLVWYVEGDPVPAARAAQMHIGMGREEVRSLLGGPNGVIVEGDGQEVWVYQRHTVKVFLVNFSSAGDVVRFGTDN